jgi:trans-2,3-dihydro-3-hydroxyanthranilate isomerase
MTRLTLESNHSENTFVYPPERGDSPRGPDKVRATTDFRVRIFGRSGEMPFAGHPTIGTAFALAQAGRIKPGTPSTSISIGRGTGWRLRG